MPFNFETFRRYRSGIRQHAIAWPWWILIRENNPTGQRMNYNPHGLMPWDDWEF